MSDVPVAHMVLTNGGPARPWIGQMVPVDVALFRPHASEGELPPFSFDELDVPGAIALLRSEAPPPSEVQKDGVTYLVQHRTLLLFPQEDGELVVPPVVARFDDPEHGTPSKVKSEELHLTVYVPHGLSDESALVVARGLTLTSKTDRPIAGLRVGDGFTRTVVLSADDTDPIMLPELSFAPSSGLRVYPAEPRAQGTAERGQIHAERSFSATYVVERAGHYELPGLSVRWLDPASGRYATAHTEALSFWARPNMSLGLAAFGSAPGLELTVLLGSLLLLMSLGYVVVRRVRSGPFAWELKLRARRRERRAFWAFERALGHASPLVLLRRAYAWLALRLPSEPRTLAPLRAASSESAESLRAWEQAAFAGPGGHAVFHGLHWIFVRARRALGKRETESSITAINPQHESKGEGSWTTAP